LRKALCDVRFPLLIGTLLVTAASGCGGHKYGSGAGTMSAPTPTANASPSGTSVVTIMGQQGIPSFQPNPAQVAVGSLVAWHNDDAQTHRIVMNDGSFDSGDIAPGASSSMMRLGANGGSYHCTIHPTMMSGTLIPMY
jgi:plastocyanin